MSDALASSTCVSEPGIKTCLNTGEVLGLAFVAEAGFISLAALLLLLLLIIRNIFRHRRYNKARWRLVRSPADAYVLALFVFDVIQGIGTVMDVRWAHLRYTEAGTFCTTQGAMQHLGETGVAFATMAIAIHTLITVWTRKGKDRFDIAIGVIVSITLFVTLYVIIAWRVNLHNGAGFYAPSPYWCWIGDRFTTDKLAGEYLWLWLTLLVSILVYVPLFLWSKGFLVVAPDDWKKIKLCWRRPRDSEGRFIHTIAIQDKLALAMLAYPVAYCFCVLPVSVARWSYFAGDRSIPTAATFFAVFTHDVFGAVNVLLLLTTRPGLLLFDAPRADLHPLQERSGGKDRSATLRSSTSSSSVLGQPSV